MAMRTNGILALAATSILLAAPAAQAAAGAPTAKGVQPTEYPGNFVSSTGTDDQVCYDMSAKGYIGEVTTEMRGFKIDPPVNYADGFVSTTISADRKYLSWSVSDNVNLHAFIIKGGNNYNLYNYVPFDHVDDQLLHSPLKGKTLPQISHYNVCYEVIPTGLNEGCTRGYWSNHTDRWAGVATSADFDATFGVDLYTPNITLLQAIKANGGGIFQLSAQATAALLNSYGGVPNPDDGDTVSDYAYTAAEIIAMVQAAVNTVDDPLTLVDERALAIDDAKSSLDAANNAGCPLGGTKATK
jgi:hypothetical protein